MADDGLPAPAASSRPQSSASGATRSDAGRAGASMGGASKQKADELPKIYTKRRVYPVAVELPPARPMSATQEARVNRVRAKNLLLGAQFLGRQEPPPAGEKGSRPDLPPWWSNERHGLPASSMAAPSKDLTTKQPIENIRSTLLDLRNSLGVLPWPDGKKVKGNDDAERRVRAEISDMEMWMRNHLRRKARDIYERTHAPAVSDKQILQVAFLRKDSGRSGDVTVSEFAAVWNSDDGLLLKVPVQKYDDDSNQMVDVYLKSEVDMDMAVERWKLNGSKWSTKLKQFSELEASKSEAGRRLLLRPKKVLEAHAAALFLKYGFDKDGLMPYEVFCNALFTPSARMLGMQPILDQKPRDRNGFGVGDDTKFDGKILYAKAKAGVFPPSDFDPECVERSKKVPSASLCLEHVYGYDGRNNLSQNIFFTDNPEEIVYYAAAVGVVHNVATDSQHFFFGHTNDIYCITQHPCLWIVATGQQKATGSENKPFCCIWETRGGKQLQKLNHPDNCRGVIAMNFSPCGKRLITITCDNSHSLFIWDWLKGEEKLRYLSGIAAEPVPGWPLQPPSFTCGPAKKLSDLENSATGFFYKKVFNYVPEGEWKLEGHSVSAKSAKIVEPSKEPLGPAQSGQLYLDEEAVATGTAGGTELEEVVEASSDETAYMKGTDFALNLQDRGAPRALDASNGSPPQVFGVVWNPYSVAPEFLTHGVKHIKFWSINAETGKWDCVSGSFGPKSADKTWVVDNVLCAVYFPDPMGPYREVVYDKETRKPLHTRARAVVWRTGKVVEQLYDENGPDPYKLWGLRYKEDVDPTRCTAALVATGFTCGDIGIWQKLESPPSSAASSGKPAKPPAWALVRVVKAHKPGPLTVMRDGSMSYLGVRDLTLTADRKTLLSAGADGCVLAWDCRQTCDDQPQLGLRALGAEVSLDPSFVPNQVARPANVRVPPPSAASLKKTEEAAAVQFRKLEKLEWRLQSAYPGRPPPSLRSVDSRPGSQDFVVGTYDCEIWMLSPGVGGGPCKTRQLVAGNSGELHGLATHPTNPKVFATSCDSGDVMLWDARQRCLMRATAAGFPSRCCAFSECGAHLAVGGENGRLRVLKTETLQPLANFANCSSGITVLRYSPNNAVLACGSHDLVVHLYDTGFRGDIDGKPPAPGQHGATLPYSVVMGVPGKINTYWDEAQGGMGCYTLLARCEGHSATIRHLDFSLPLWNPPELRGRTVVVSQCAGHEILYFDSRTGAQVLQNMRSAKWATRTQTLGFDVMGIWPDGSMAVQVDSLARSRSHEYAATGDHFSGVKLFNYPVVYDDAPFREYVGHASYVTSVRWAADDRRLYSAGGGDRCVFQWRSTGVAKEDAFKGPVPEPAQVGGPPRKLVSVSVPDNVTSRRRETPWCDVAMCTFCDRMELKAPPPPLYGPLDVDGRILGPITYSSRTGACSCKNCPLRMRRELKAFDPKDTGGVTAKELMLGLCNFGEVGFSEEKAAKLIADAKCTPIVLDFASANDREPGNQRYPVEELITEWMKDIKRRQEKYSLGDPDAKEDDDS